MKFLPTLVGLKKNVYDLKEFINITKRADVKSIRIKKNEKNQVKFKVRCSKYLYTLVLNDPSKAKKLRESLPHTIEPVEIKKSGKK
ncbi:ribosomal protein L38e [Rozella allomycis CSF55]|uniref:Ribosomal protein L38e n=1 Tax=Rozella allomycis (strain CSF55) TaxID=988480 RepID=A0A075AN43_ROZAC|nr:Ribosomal protein L38e domain-containing protein [Rozella allomycis CSF55]RKP21340.1 ribosomal protein L38e [Rozella allomycis CSF55]|eukprot:EPZ31181.1 Ribosomal protein L38e domain-containing protein [Rozella allomycis CSF55]